MKITICILWISILLFIFPYTIYPIIINLLGKAKKEKKLINKYKTISMIIPAYNEKNVIAQKIKNCISLKYPMDKVEILVGSDGSEDGTNEIVRELSELYPQIKFVEFKQRRGKISVLNDLVSIAKNEIIVFSDANCILSTDCLSFMDKHFSNDEVGCVSGVKKINEDNTKLTSSNEGLYWKLETFIKKSESKLFSLIGADGALLAIRKNLYKVQDKDTILDDFMITMRILVRDKKRIVFETNAVAYEDAESDFHKEFRRKTRIAAGAFQAMNKLGFINPFTYVGFGYIFHKILRWFSPLLLIVCLISNSILLFNNLILYKMLFMLQIIYYILIFLGHYLEKNHRKISKVINILFYFNLTVFAQFCGFIRFLGNRQAVTWDKENR